ncbi:MAG: hypothetical protein WA081_00685 [Desulfosalsimonadaceae bacterium]
MTPSDPFEKRIKRHVLGKFQSFYISTLPGVEHLCAAELAGMGPAPAEGETGRGGVEFTGRIPDCYRANLHLRTANRVLMRVDEFTATNFRQLTKKTADFPWELHLNPSAAVNVHVTTRHSRLMHTEAVADHFKSGLYARLERPAVDTEKKHPADGFLQRIFIRAEDDRFTVSLDSSGDLLHKRGLKVHGGTAPIRETIAAAILMLSGYRPGDPLVDPMCGAGTFSLEAAMMAGGIPAGWYRGFAFMNWPCFKTAQWNHIRLQAEKKMTRMSAPVVFASDIHPDNCLALEKIFQSDPLMSETARVTDKDFFALHPSELDIPAEKRQNGLIAINPPYGLRLGSKDAAGRLIADIGRKLKKDFRGWRLALIVPDNHLITHIPFHVTSHHLFHGGLTVTLLTGRIQ